MWHRFGFYQKCLMFYLVQVYHHIFMLFRVFYWLLLVFVTIFSGVGFARIFCGVAFFWCFVVLIFIIVHCINVLLFVRFCDIAISAVS